MTEIKLLSQRPSIELKVVCSLVIPSEKHGFHVLGQTGLLKENLHLKEADKKFTNTSFPE